MSIRSVRSETQPSCTLSASRSNALDNDPGEVLEKTRRAILHSFADTLARSECDGKWFACGRCSSRMFGTAQSLSHELLDAIGIIQVWCGLSPSVAAMMSPRATSSVATLTIVDEHGNRLVWPLAGVNGELTPAVEVFKALVAWTAEHDDRRCEVVPLLCGEDRARFFISSRRGR